MDYQRNRRNQCISRRHILCLHISAKISGVASGIGLSNTNWTHYVDCLIGASGAEMDVATIVPFYDSSDSGHLST